ncbi:hypothetical protein H6503_06775 [Candidatus Woesearchaeota archaeon]|nr:hypothetical protein [Candidatus Woesearchaeota archaeon]
MTKPFLCKIGLHKFSRARTISSGFRSRVLDVEKRCSRCGFVKRKTIPK